MPYLRVCKPHFFWQEFTLQNWGAAYARNIVLFTTEPAMPVLYVMKLPVETASVWDLSCKPLYARIRQRIIGVSACFDYMGVADTIDSQKSEDCDITEKLP
jgi:hypothetical protein